MQRSSGNARHIVRRSRATTKVSLLLPLQSICHVCFVGGKLFSFACLVEVAQTKGYRLVKAWKDLRDPQSKFEAVLSVTEGRYMVLTNVCDVNQRTGANDLERRNLQHWIAIDGGLVIDSLARTAGPQKLTYETLKRSVRQGIVRIYKILPK